MTIIIRIYNISFLSSWVVFLAERFQYRSRAELLTKPFKEVYIGVISDTVLSITLL